MAKKNVSLFVSAVGWIASLVEKLINVLREKGVTDEEIHGLVTKSGDVLIGVIADAVITFLKKTKEVIYSIFVNYSMSIEEMVKLSNFDWTDNDIITKNFPTMRTGIAILNVKLFHFDQAISSEDVIREMDKQRYRAADLHELLAFGVMHPDVQLEFPIIALGSIWQYSKDCYSVAYLGRDGSKRRLNLGNFNYVWGSDGCFAAVRK